MNPKMRKNSAKLTKLPQIGHTEAHHRRPSSSNAHSSTSTVDELSNRLFSQLDQYDKTYNKNTTTPTTADMLLSKDLTAGKRIEGI